jgi:hypothetical protein
MGQSHHIIKNLDSIGLKFTVFATHRLAFDPTEAAPSSMQYILVSHSVSEAEEIIGQKISGTEELLRDILGLAKYHVIGRMVCH